MLFINAASETTATALTGVVNNLLQNPESLLTLEAEIRGFSSPSDLTLPTLKQLPYLNAVLKETLRMCNPKWVGQVLFNPYRPLQLTNCSPIGHMRITPPNGGIVAGHFVPGNVSFSTILPG
jgi:hypothetical protein